MLDLSFNRLTTVPESIAKLQNLTYLDLSNNQLTTVPASLAKLQNLKTLELKDNPIKTPPPEIVFDKRGTTDLVGIKNYYRQLERAEKDYLYEAKLLIVGEGGAGKTTLARKIEDKNYELKEAEPTTQGIDVITWEFPWPGKPKNFRVNIWDFGGQEIYHATHQFFLTKRSLYALVADSRIEDTDFYYWLNVVELLSDSAPLWRIYKNGCGTTNSRFNATRVTSRSEIDLYADIRHYLPHLTDILKDMNTLTAQIHSETGFAELVKVVVAKIR